MYIDFVRKKLPLLLTQIDRDKHSETYGCCDRNFWHLKIRDFSSAILQQSGLALAIAYCTNFDGNIYFQNRNVKQWAEATVRYWCRIQLPDGSYNEYYPWEHGFPPTAFSLFSTCETYKRLQMNDKEIEKSIRKTALYLSRTIEKQAMNQEIASVAALYSAYTILGESWISDAAESKLNLALMTQNSEGWFPEYGGADIGYLSVSLDMLSEYYWMSKDEKALESINKIFEFIKYFVHPDGTCGGEYGSRNTTYFLPNGLEVLSALGNSCSERIIRHLFGDCLKPEFFMDSVDDRYLSHYVLHSFLRALEKRIGNKHPDPGVAPFLENHNVVFPEAGLISFKNDLFSGILSTRKGGVVKAFDSDGKECFLDCGYRINYGKGSVAATNWTDPRYEVSYERDGAIIRGYLNKVGLKVPSPILHFGLRVVAFFSGKRIIGFLKRKIILVDKHSDIWFERSVSIDEKQILIYDEVKSPQKVTIEKAGNMSLRHVASGKFFEKSDLITPGEGPLLFDNVQFLKLMTRLSFCEGSVEIEYDRLG